MTSVEARLADQAADFSTRLTNLLNGTITRGAKVTSAMVPSGNGSFVAVVAPGAAESAPSLPRRPAVPLSTAATSRKRQQARLWLMLSFQMTLDQEREWAAVQKSGFGLCVSRETTRQAIRIEYDRSMKKRPAAHVHVQGHSAELGFAFGVANRSLLALDRLHVPVGGQRFRPCLEDFIEFLESEGLITDLQPGWRKVLKESRREFSERQLRAAVRRDQQVAAQALQEQGWSVDPPTG